MDTIVERTTREEQRIAKSSIGKLKKNSGKLKHTRGFVEIKFLQSSESVKIPQKALYLLSVIVNNMAEGKSMVLMPSDTILSTQAAADYLNISRPYLVKLLERGEIPFIKAGTHRRIELNDLLAYQKKLKVNRGKQLDFLTKQAQDLNLGYS
ncbi:helix-turn-helix domain-containing protein [Compostibacter hankyongensis]|uniref:Helix-turn-helix domain-containing protein n=1 Tax=Compostibacter hankyongensis TaxID=1007089 RepID=A0ABP8FK11_9BACT